MRKPLLASDLTAAQLEELRDLGQLCYSSCLRCLSMFNDVDVGALVGSTLSSSKVHFNGDASQWHDLVTECAPRIPRMVGSRDPENSHKYLEVLYLCGNC